MKKLKQSFNHPDDDFVRFLAADIYPNRITTKAIERLQPLVKQAVSTTLVAMVSKGLASSISEADDDDISQEKPDSVEKSPESDNTSKVETTQQELDAYKFILDAIEQEFGAKSEVNYKDTQSYFSIQIQKPSRWFCRLHFNNQKRIYVAFRLSENKAKELVHPELIESYTSSTTDGCSVTFENQNSLQAMLPLFLESYKSIANEYKVGVSAEL